MPDLNTPVAAVRVILYCGPETQWEPKRVLEYADGRRGLMRELRAPFSPFLFDSTREAVFFARERKFDYVLLAEGTLG